MNRTYTQTILALGSLIAVVGSGCNAATTAATEEAATTAATEEAAATVTSAALDDGSWTISDCASGARSSVTSSGGTITLTTQMYFDIFGDPDAATCTAEKTSSITFVHAVTASVGTEAVAVGATSANLLTATIVSSTIITNTADGIVFVGAMCPSASFTLGGLTDVAGQTCTDEAEFVFPSVGDTVYSYVAIRDSVLYMRRTGLGAKFGATDSSLLDLSDFDASETFIAQ